MIAKLFALLSRLISSLTNWQNSRLKASDEKLNALRVENAARLKDMQSLQASNERLSQENAELRTAREADQKQILALTQRLSDLGQAHEQQTEKLRNLPAADVWNARLPGGTIRSS